MCEIKCPKYKDIYSIITHKQEYMINAFEIFVMSVSTTIKRFGDAVDCSKQYSLKELQRILSTAFLQNVKADKKIEHTDSMPKNTTKVLTEDTGKIFEMAICLAFGIKYDGPFKYDIKQAEALSSRLSNLTSLFPQCLHTAKKGARYDFTSIEDKNMHMSAKTTKKAGGKVAPQVIGQSQPKKFCEIVGMEYDSIPMMKKYIQENPKTLLPILVAHTFDCINLYYNQEKDTIKLINLETDIDWNDKVFKWTCGVDSWKNSSTLKIEHNGKDLSLVEFQFHTKSRTNMAVRWFYDNFLHVFEENLSITVL